MLVCAHRNTHQSTPLPPRRRIRIGGENPGGSAASGWVQGFGTLSLRHTKHTLIYRRTGNLRAVQLSLGDTTIESAVGRYAPAPRAISGPGESLLFVP